MTQQQEDIGAQIIGSLAAVPIFYNFPAALLTGTALAGGIALINAIGNLAGFIGPSVIGWAKQMTGSDAGGQLALAVVCALAPLLVCGFGDRTADLKFADGKR
jgi:MFS transporter, ACS family, tartrate transporter